MRKTVISLPPIHIDKDALRQRIGQRIRERREALQISQATLAESCGIYRTHLSRVENGVGGLTSEKIAALETALGVDLLEDGANDSDV